MGEIHRMRYLKESDNVGNKYQQQVDVAPEPLLPISGEYIVDVDHANIRSGARTIGCGELRFHLSF